ncbi:MAG: DALR domain-containing protein, partial [Actinomycetota bacterium]|nr:DALR domain-containing protein [Actinomycetota bacterium]
LGGPRPLWGPPVEAPAGAPPHDPALDAFCSAMDDDFGTPSALDGAFGLIRGANIDLDNGDLSAAGVGGRTAITMFSVLGIDIGSGTKTTEVGPSDQEIEDLLEQRAQARAAKDFAAADSVRDQLTASGIIIEDTANGVVWHRA